MAILCGLLYFTGVFPLWRAWEANRRSSLAHALVWVALAWTAWWAATLASIWGWEASEAALPRYLALCLTACAGVAVLGARRPGVGPWNFVLAGLLAVLLLPVAYGWGKPKPEWANIAFLAGVIAVGVLNYLPSRMAPAAVVLAVGCGVELADWFRPGIWGEEWTFPTGPVLVGLCPWVAFLQTLGRTEPPTEFDRLWLRFRDRYGLVWGQRLREQFNRAAVNAGWPVTLRWSGLRRKPGTEMPDLEVQQSIVDALRALLKRFEEGETESPPGDQ